MQPYQSLSCPQMEVVYVPFVPRLLFPISRGMWKISTVQENFHVPIVLKCSPAKISWLVMSHKHVKKRGKCYHSILHLNFDCIQYFITLNKYKTIELRQTYLFCRLQQADTWYLSILSQTSSEYFLPHWGQTYSKSNSLYCLWQSLQINQQNEGSQKLFSQKIDF